MKIVYCLQATYNSGGMERIVIDKINYLSKRGYEIILVTTNQENRLPFFPIDNNVKLIDLAVNYHELEGFSFLRKGRLLIKKRTIHKNRLLQVILKEHPDIVISTFGNEINFLHEYCDGSKKIAEIHFTRNYRLLLKQSKIKKIINKFITYRYKQLAKKYDAFVCLTEEDKKNWGSLNNLYVIPNFIHSQSPTQSTLQNKKIITVGRFNYQKGYDRLLNAWANVIAIHPDWILEIYGDGEEKESIFNQIRSLNLQKNVSVFPPVNNIYLPMCDASIYVMASRYEGLPMVLLEAMTCGLPIVSFDCPCGPKDLLSNEVGILIPDGNIKKLSNEIAVLISNRNLRSQLGNRSIQESYKYTPDQIMPLWINLFDKLIYN